MINLIDLLVSEVGIELDRFKSIEFFPPRPPRLHQLESICIATKSRNLGDALALTTLPGALKRIYPRLSISTYPRAFNAAVFYGNPAVDKLNYLPSNVFGDDCNSGQGQLIQLKEEYFGLPVNGRPKPFIELMKSEKSWAQRFVNRKLLPGNDSKPLCIIHPWGTTRSTVQDVETWDETILRWHEKIRFWQVGVEGHLAVQGCEYYLLLPRAFRQVRKLFAITSQADIFVGVDSGPMHVARGFDLPSLIYLDHVNPESAFAMRERAPYFIHDNWKHSALYSENEHLDLRELSRDAVRKRTDVFFEQHLHRTKTRGTSTSTSP